ncbi:MAG: c-type cytochrome [Deltaproteobacteria bacterium]|nr:c-type cytochrome [Deltaproteobacteria bacterium]
MKKQYSFCKFDMLILWVICSMLVLPTLVFAHGWKAPPAAAQITNPIQLNAASIQKGQHIYGNRCASCHGEGGGGDGPLAEDLKPSPADLVKRLEGHSEGDFFWKISNGRGTMPSFRDQLTEKQIWMVINYLKTLMGQ